MVGHLTWSQTCFLTLPGRKEIKMQKRTKKRILTPLISPQKFGIDASKDKADTPVVARVAGGDCNQ